MPSSVRPRGGGGTNRSLPVTPMSERQQLALLMQMTSSNNDVGSRSPSSSSSSRSRDRNERGETPLHLAAIKGDVEQVCRLLAHHADPNVADFAGWTPLHEACNHGWYDVAYRLVQTGANVNAKGFDNDTPLHDAVLNGHLKLVKLLVERGADIHAKNSKGKTPLDVASPTVQPYLLNSNLPLPDTATSTRLQPRSRDDKKITDSSGKQKNNQSADDTMEAGGGGSGAGGKASSSNAADDVYEFKSVKESSDSSPDRKSADPLDVESEATDPLSITANSEESAKRSFTEIDRGDDTGNDDESRKKKRKDDSSKDGKAGTQRSTGPNKGQGGNKAGGGQNKSSALGSNKSSSADKKSPCSSPKPATSNSDAEVEDGKSDLKVPPLKIVIPQSSNEQETSRNGKTSSQRAHQALPYVVASSNSNDSNEMASGTASPEGTSNSKGDDKKDGSGNGQGDDQRGGGLSHQRVLRSSHRGGTSQSTDRGSNNSSPQLQRSHSPSPTSSPAASNIQTDAPPTTGTSTSTTSKSSDAQTTQNPESESSTSTSSLIGTAVASAPVELHPRKRKMKPNKEPAVPPAEPAETPVEPQIHPHDQPITNCYELFMNIRKQINKRRRGLLPVQPKPPQGFKDYLMNRCTYLLKNRIDYPAVKYPSTPLPPYMHDFFVKQDHDRSTLQIQHVIEKEKLVLSVEQEILRVHGRAARALAYQSLPYSVCTILKDEEVYNLITPEQEEKDRNLRSRYNGRLFLSWLQDVDDKWEKIKEAMLVRHHTEAEALRSRQIMEWEEELFRLNICDRKTTPKIEEGFVPLVHVSDDFDLLPSEL